MPKLTNESLALKLGWKTCKTGHKESISRHSWLWKTPKGDLHKPDSLPNWLGDPTTIIAEIEARGLAWMIQPGFCARVWNDVSPYEEDPIEKEAKTPALALATALAAYLDSQEKA